MLGLAGLLGSGRTELARILSGVDRTETGRIVYEGKPRHFSEPREALAVGVAYSSEDREHEGIIAELSVRENILLALQAEQGWVRRIARRRGRDELTASWIEALDIRPANGEHPAGLLSGGNQQKVMLARLLAVAPRVLVLDEPTRGIDVGAKIEVQRVISDLAATGMSVVFISAELEEVLRVSDRILVLRDRRAVAELDPGRSPSTCCWPSWPRPIRTRSRRLMSAGDKLGRGANIFDVARLAGRVAPDGVAGLQRRARGPPGHPSCGSNRRSPSCGTARRPPRVRWSRGEPA